MSSLALRSFGAGVFGGGGFGIGPVTEVARASFGCWVSWSAYNIGLLTFDSSLFDGSDVFAVSPTDATFEGIYDDLSAIFDGYTASRGRTSNLDQVAAG